MKKFLELFISSAVVLVYVFFVFIGFINGLFLFCVLDFNWWRLISFAGSILLASLGISVYFSKD